MAYVNPNTGGTQAPGSTTPKGGGGEKRYWNTRTNRMETAKAMRGVNHPNVRVGAVSKTLGAPSQKPAPAKAAAPAKAKSAYLGGEIVDPLNLLSRAQKQSMAYGIRGQEEGEKALTQKPYQQRAQEIGNTQGIVTGKISGLNTQNNTFMQGLIAGQEGSAKTANNFAAENALSAQKAVETAGQNAITSTGGELSPALRGQLSGQTNLEATQQRGEAGVQAMRTLAAAAAAQGQAGLTAANERFAGEEGKNRGQENTALERIAAKGKAERVELPQKEYADLLAKNKLESSNAIAGEKLAQGRVKLGNEGRRVSTQEQSTANRRRGEEERNATGRANAETNRGRLGVSQQKLSIEAANGQSKREHEHADSEYKIMSASDKRAYDEAQIAWKNYTATHPKPGGTTGVTNARKWIGELSQVEAKIRSAIGGSMSQQARTARGQTQDLRNKFGSQKGFSTELINAALNLIGYGRLGPQDRESAFSHGVQPSWKPAWFRTK